VKLSGEVSVVRCGKGFFQNLFHKRSKIIPVAKSIAARKGSAVISAVAVTTEQPANELLRSEMVQNGSST